MGRMFIGAALLAALCAAGASADAVKQGDLTISDARVFETPPLARVGAGYLTIANDGEGADTLIGLAGAYPRVELHQSVEADGVMTMRPVDRLEIPAGGQVVLEPGGHHIMIMGLTPDTGFDLGQTVPLTLVFDRAGEVAVTFEVVARGAGKDH